MPEKRQSVKRFLEIFYQNQILDFFFFLQYGGFFMNEMRINRFSEEGVMKRGLTVILAALVLLTGCELRYRAISKLDITDAESLYLASEAEARGTGNVMFKITKEGAVVEVSYTSNSGIKASAKSLKPNAIYHANDEYMIVVFDYRFACLVSKTTGAVYSLDNVGYPEPKDPYGNGYMFANSSPVLSDGKNNIYFKTYFYSSDNPDKSYELYRIDVTNPAKVFAQPLTAPNDYVNTFAVDAAGNVVYDYHDINSNYGTRLVFAGGGFAPSENIPSIVWTAPDGKLYYQGDEVYDETTGESGYPIYRLDIEGQKVTETEYGKVKSDYNYYIDNSSYYLMTDKRAYLLKAYGILLEVYNPEDNPNVTTLDYKLTGSAVDVSEDGGLVYVTGQREVVCIDLNAKTWRYLYQSDEYEIYEATYSGQGVTVNAMRFRDGRIIMGKIDREGKMEVLDETSNSKVLYLTRIR